MKQTHPPEWHQSTLSSNFNGWFYALGIETSILFSIFPCNSILNETCFEENETCIDEEISRGICFKFINIMVIWWGPLPLLNWNSTITNFQIGLKKICMAPLHNLVALWRTDAAQSHATLRVEWHGTAPHHPFRGSLQCSWSMMRRSPMPLYV